MALFVLLAILALSRFAKGVWSRIAILLGLIIGSALAAALGMMNFDHVVAAPLWWAWSRPFAFGLPRFDPISILTMCVVMVVVMIESTGMFLAVGEMVGRPVVQSDPGR